MKDCNLFLPVHGGDARAVIEEEWRWLLGERSVRPVRMTIWGDWFVEDKKTGEVFFLDAGFARLEKAAPSRAALTEALRDPKKRRQWLLEKHVAALHAMGIRLKWGECYSWRVLPSVGGQVDVDNVDCTDVALHQHLASRIGYVASKLPEGTRFTGEMFETVMDTLDDPIAVLHERFFGEKSRSLTGTSWVRVAGVVAALLAGVLGVLSVTS